MAFTTFNAANKSLQDIVDLFANVIPAVDGTRYLCGNYLLVSRSSWGIKLNGVDDVDDLRCIPDGCSIRLASVAG